MKNILEPPGFFNEYLKNSSTDVRFPKRLVTGFNTVVGNLGCSLIAPLKFLNLFATPSQITLSYRATQVPQFVCNFRHKLRNLT